jgi:hypothetical protein
METTSKEENISLKNGLKIGLNTLVACFVVIMFSLTFIFVLFPKFSLKINNSLGLDGVKELNYQMIYNRSGKITDLYNVILYECELGKTSKELGYIEEMIARDDYNEFCETMDKASLKSVKDKNMLPYSVNVNGYLLSRKVICLYNLKKEGLETYVYRQTSIGKISEYSFSTYVDLIYNDNSLTDAQKREKLAFLMNINEVKNNELISQAELLDLRIGYINDRLISEKDKEEQIALQYTLTRIYRSRYYVYEVLGSEEKSLKTKLCLNLQKQNLIK